MKKLLEGIHVIEGIGAALIFVLGPQDGFTLIDTGIFKRTHLLIAQLEEHNYAITNLRNIILTHCHCDHIGGVTELVKYSGAKVAAHESDIPYILQEQVVPGPYQRMMLQEQKVMKQFSCNVQRVDIALRDGDIIDVLGGLHVIQVPGHTPGSIALYQPDRQIMFWGDVIRNHPRQGLRVGIPEEYNVNTQQTRADANKLLAYAIECALFSHGAPILGNASQIIRAAVNYPLPVQQHPISTKQERNHDQATSSRNRPRHTGSIQRHRL